MNITEYLSSSHPDDLRYCLSIAHAVRNLEQLSQQVTTAENKLFPTCDNHEKFVRRFLLFGNAEGIYFASQNKFTCTLVFGLCRLIQSGKGLMILRQILEMSEGNRAPKQEPLLMALALCARYKIRDTQSKKKLPWDTMEEDKKLFPDAVCRDIRPVLETTYQRCLQKLALFAVHKVCVQPTHLFMFIKCCKVVSKESGLKKFSNGWGRALRATVAKWYFNHTPNRLAFIATKYRHRVSYSHRDLFCLSHIHPKQSFQPEHHYWQHQKEYESIFKYLVKGHKGKAREERERKRRQGSSSAGNSKRGFLNPNDAEQVQKNLAKTSLQQVEERNTSEGAGGSVSPVINAIAYVDAFNKLQKLTCANLDEAVSLILQYGFEKEHVPQKLLSSKEVWGALLRRMSLRTILKNMDQMNAVNLFNEQDNSVFKYLAGVLSNISSFFHEDWENYTKFTNDNPVSLVVRNLVSREKLMQERVHPLAILLARTSYEYGLQVQGNQLWRQVNVIQRAFDRAFCSSMNVVQPAQKRYLIAVDISDSMDSFVRGTTVACSQAAATLAMTIIQHETNVISLAFSDILIPLEWNRFMSLGEYLAAAKKLRYGTTDCAQPMCWAIEHVTCVDVFVILTDDDVSVKSMKPSDAIQWYRQKMDIPNAKLIVVGMTDKSGALANPNDPNMLFICGMNPSVPQIMHDFILL